MAIQISGTTVVNDSRQLQNIASLDSTTTTTLQGAGLGGIGFTSGTNLYNDTSFNNSDEYIFPTGEGDYLILLGNSKENSSSWYIYLSYTSSSRIRGGWYSGPEHKGFWENNVNRWRQYRQSNNTSMFQSGTTIATIQAKYTKFVVMRLSLGSGSDQVRFYTQSSQDGGQLSVIGIS